MSTIPLDPGTGGRCILPDALAPADIIVSTASGFVSWAIRNATKSEVSHAAMFLGHSQVIEAINSGVHSYIAESSER